MPPSRSAAHGNHLLASLAPADLAIIQPNLETVALAGRLVLEAPNKPIRHVYFPIEGMLSVVAPGPEGRKIEVGIIGSEGMSGIPVVLGNGRSTNETVVQVTCKAARISADHLRKALLKSPSIQRCFLHYAQAFMCQAANTAMANGRGKLEERLARWLLMANDRLAGNEVPLTHEFLAVMLGVRRAGVTTALHLLESQALVRARRGTVVILDRAGIEKLANGLYGVPEAEYLRLTGWRGKR